MTFLRRLLSGPMEVIKAPATVISGTWQDGGRGQFLVLGIPAVIFLLLGLTALGLAFSNDNRLRYQGLATSAREKAQQLRTELRGDFVPEVDVSKLDDDDPRKKLEYEQSKERIYLDKLISIDPKVPEHKFQLAMLALRKGDMKKCESLMQVVAPFETSGYAKAHLFLAELYLNRIQKQRTTADKQLDFQRAEKQVDNALVADESNETAKRYKAFILMQKGSYPDALEIYKDLFKTDPVYYRELVQLSSLLKKPQEAKQYLTSASNRFRQKINKGIENVEEWVVTWKHYIYCLAANNDFNSAENALKSEIDRFRDEIGKEVFLKQQLSAVYSGRALVEGRDASPDIMTKQLSDLDKALQNDPKNEVALEWLTYLGTQPEIGDEARKVYDPRADPDPHWRVLSELGSHALDEKDFENAIIFFERARKKNPRNSKILNNLAYAYLVSEDRNPEQSLLLVDQAFINLPGSGLETNPLVLSSFYDTRGTALMQLGRMEEAAADLENAFRNRPDSLKILEKLIECYTATGNARQAETYRRRAEILKQQSPTGGEGPAKDGRR